MASRAFTYFSTPNRTIHSSPSLSLTSHNLSPTLRNQIPSNSLHLSANQPVRRQLELNSSMALQVHVSLTTYSSICSSPSWSPKQSSLCLSSGDQWSSSSGAFPRSISGGGERRREKIGSRSIRVRSSLDTAGPVVTVGQVTEVDKDTFWPLVKAAGDKTVVLDMYTQWCGPCKVMAPKFEGLSQKLLDVVFLKLDCNQENRPLAKELGIKVVPTFKILKDGKVVKEVTGAKFDDLVAAIEIVKSS